MAIRTDKFTEGFVIFDDDKKLAVVTTKTFEGVVKHGLIQFSLMPKEHWIVHFTAPSMKPDALQAVANAVNAWEG